MKEQRVGSGLDEAHKVYVNSDTVLEDYDEPVSSRYEEIVTAVPELARRKLYEDCTDLFEHAYQNESGERLTQFLHWAAIQRGFWLFLYGNDMCGVNTLGIKMNSCQLWHDRLFWRHHNMKPWRRGGKNGSRILKPSLGALSETERRVTH